MTLKELVKKEIKHSQNQMFVAFREGEVGDFELEYVDELLETHSDREVTRWTIDQGYLVAELKKED